MLFIAQQKKIFQVANYHEKQMCKLTHAGCARPKNCLDYAVLHGEPDMETSRQVSLHRAVWRFFAILHFSLSGGCEWLLFIFRHEVGGLYDNFYIYMIIGPFVK